MSKKIFKLIIFSVIIVLIYLLLRNENNTDNNLSINNLSKPKDFRANIEIDKKQIIKINYGVKDKLIKDFQTEQQINRTKKNIDVTILKLNNILKEKNIMLKKHLVSEKNEKVYLKKIKIIEDEISTIHNF